MGWRMFRTGKCGATEREPGYKREEGLKERVKTYIQSMRVRLTYCMAWTKRVKSVYITQHVFQWSGGV